MENNTAVKGYKLDFTTNSIIMNYTFHANSEEYGSPEYELLKKILADFPQMKMAVKSGREKKTANKNKRLTYENMKKYISVCENADELLAVFESVEASSKSAKSPYKYVCDWFTAQFPDYNKSVVFNNGKLVAAPEKKIEKKDYTVKIGAKTIETEPVIQPEKKSA